MSNLSFIADNKLYALLNGVVTPITCQAIENYKSNLESIKRRRDWKSSGTGAAFMGVEAYDNRHSLDNAYVSDVVKFDQENAIYVARLDEGLSIATKSLVNPERAEGLLLRKENLIAHDVCFDVKKQRLIFSAGQADSHERHLCVMAVEGKQLQFITEGDCQDANPTVNPQNLDEILYDSCGFAFNQHELLIGPKEINCLNMATGEVKTLFADENFDYFKPQLDSQHNLYFIKRPYRENNLESNVDNVKAVLSAPFKILKAIVGWLDFFTRRYSGESLKKTTGTNPAKVKQKSEEELFIEGNLIRVQQNLANNKQAGDKFAGSIPRSWELIKATPDGTMTVIKKGVMSYCLADDKILLSNGKHVLSIDKDNQETLLLEQKMVRKISVSLV